MLNEYWMVDKNSDLQSWFFYHLLYLQMVYEISKIKYCEGCLVRMQHSF